MGSYMLQANDPSLVYCTATRSASCSRESLIMEWIKAQNKKLRSHGLFHGSISRIFILPQCPEIGISHIRLPYLRKYRHRQPALLNQ